MINHENFMQRALECALKGKGKTSPNPMVGCVIVKSGKIVSEGWHKRLGADHAEIMALKKLKGSAKGARMYVNLEPCAHQGRTPPCVDQIIASGIKHVTIALKDPNPLTNGKSIRKLRRAGVKVQMGVLKGAAQELNAPFLKFIKTGIPFTVVKLAQTLDGKIATATGDSKWITSSSSRAYARKQRDHFDAIVAGKNTVIKDNPRLTGTSKSSRLKTIILDSALSISEKSQCLHAKPAEDIILVITPAAPLAKRRRFEKKGYTIIEVPAKRGRINVKRLWKILGERGIMSILVEGGAEVAGSVLRNNLADQVHCYIAPKILGDQQAKSSVVGIQSKKIHDCLTLNQYRVHFLDPDILIESYV